MRILKYMLWGAIGCGLTACNMQSLEAKQSQKFDEMTKTFRLTTDEIDIAKRLLSGYKNELKTPVLHSRDLHQAICYATSVDMPAQYTKAHLLYLEHYVQADEDYYVWFANQGINEADAEKMGNIYLAAHDTCKSTQGRLRNMKELKNRR